MKRTQTTKKESASHRPISLASQAGQSTVEYMLLLSFAVVISTMITSKLLVVLDSSILGLGAGLENQLKTGRLPATVWKN